jgi:hypothetical protein
MSHLREATLRNFDEGQKPSPFQAFEREFELAQSRGSFCDCSECPQCVGRKNAMLDNQFDELMTELESE